MSLQVWLPLNGSLRNYGLSDATFKIQNHQDKIIPTSNGKIFDEGYARIEKNTTEYIKSSKTFSFPNDFSMCCWCKVTGFANRDSANGIITNHSHETGGAGIGIKVIPSIEGKEDFRISCSTGFGPSHDNDITKTQRTFNYFYGTTNIYNKWHHLALTYNRTAEIYNLYVDGIVEKTFQFKDAIGERPFNIFDWSTSYSHADSYKAPCELNDVRLYDHCLSQREVVDIATGLLLHYKLNDTSENAKVIKDSSICENHGMINGTGVYEDSTIQYNTNLKLDNSNYITCGRSSDAEHASVSMWIKPGEIPSANQVVFADYSSQLSFGFYSFKADDETDYISKKAIISCAGQYSNVVSNLEGYWKKDDWNHIVVTKSGVDYNCYLNNNKLPKITKTNYWDHFAENTLTIGCRNNGAPNTFYAGGISDFRMYGTTLSEDIIKQLYQTPISLSNNYTLFSNELLEEENSTSSFLKTGTVKANEIRDCKADGQTPAAKLQIFEDAIQSTDFIEW